MQRMPLPDNASDDKFFNRLGFSLLGLAAASFLLPAAAYVLTGILFPEYQKSGLFLWLIYGLGFWVVGISVFSLLTRRLEGGPESSPEKMTVSKFLFSLVICVGAYYLANSAGVILSSMLSVIRGEALLNPVAAAVSSSGSISSLLLGCIVYPVACEYVFRGILLNRVRRFGDMAAIIITATAFGLFSGNLQRLFGTAALGAVLAYIAILTRGVLWPSLLHSATNIILFIAVPWLASGFWWAKLAAGAIIVLSIAGAALILWYGRRAISFSPPLSGLKGKKLCKTALLTPGAVSYVVFCACVIICFILL